MVFLTKNEERMGLIVFALSFLTYCLTLCPTVSTGDCGDLIAAAYTLGVPHPPGYPLYCLFGKLFTYLPLGSIALRVSLMSAFFASLSAVVLYLVIFKLISQINPEAPMANKFLPSISSSLVFAFSRTFWSQAVIAEVYTLWIFVLNVSFLTLIVWAQKQKDSLLYLFSFIYGTAITCHQLSLFFAPGFFLLVVLYQPRMPAKTVLGALSLFLLGLCLYLYAPLRAMSNPALNWNKVHDVNSFVDYLLRRQYGDPKSNFDPAYITGIFKLDLNIFRHYFKFLKSEFGYIFVIALLGCIPLLQKAKRFALMLIVILLFAGLRICKTIQPVEYSIYIGRVYLLAGYIIIALLLGLGLFFLIDLAFRKTRRALFYALIFVIAFLPASLLLSNYLQNDQSRNYVAYDFGRNILDTLDKDAILLGQGDNIVFILAYLTMVEKLRPDVAIYDDIGGEVFKDTAFNLALLTNEQQDAEIEKLLKTTQRPLYISFGHKLLTTTKHPRELLGVVCKFLRSGEHITQGAKEKYWLGYRLDDVFEGSLENKDFSMRYIISLYHLALGSYYLSSHNELAAFNLFSEGSELAGNNKFTQETLAMLYSSLGMSAEAIAASQKAVEFEPQDPETHYNLGVSFARAARYEEAIASWRAALKLNPDFLNVKEYIEKARKLLKEEARRSP